MDALANFFYMGGYAVYIWPAYGITSVVLLFQFFYVLRKRKKQLAQLAELFENNSQKKLS